MPLYEYECENCGDVFEVMQKFADDPLTVHEKCGGPVHRRISAPALRFKGSGWYVNDYAKGSSGTSESKTNGNTSGAESAPATPGKTDTTPSTSTTSSSSSDKT
ncbi:MAG TPA: FmdB family zinc ribbon protein [Bryobacteraceae bacterium]|nr:FmdB family zinc ribbon protein [Bryobacteraceae bacterium]